MDVSTDARDDAPDAVHRTRRADARPVGVVAA